MRCETEFAAWNPMLPNALIGLMIGMVVRRELFYQTDPLNTYEVEAPVRTSTDFCHHKISTSHTVKNKRKQGSEVQPIDFTLPLLNIVC